MFWRRLASSFGKQPCLTWRWSWPRHNCGWRGFFFFVFREEEEEEGREREIDENCNRQPSRLMEMGSNALDRNVERKGEGVLDSSLCYSLLYEGREIFFWLWKIKGRENFRWTREGIVELKGCKSRWERRVCFYLVSVFGINWKREREGK